MMFMEQISFLFFRVFQVSVVIQKSRVDFDYALIITNIYYKNTCPRLFV